MARVYEVYGLLPAEETDAVIDDLEQHGILPEEIHVDVPDPGRYQVADTELAGDVRGAGRTALIGAVIGTIIGLAVMSLVSEVASYGPLGIATGGFAGACFGVLIGGMVGLQRVGHDDDDPLRWREVRRGGDARVVSVLCGHWASRARRILLSHGAELLDGHDPTVRA